MRTTHTYAVLEVSEQTFKEVTDSLRAAGYDHSFMPDGEIDMHGIAIACTKIIRCEHGVADGDWCEPCNKEYKRAADCEGK